MQRRRDTDLFIAVLTFMLVIGQTEKINKKCEIYDRACIECGECDQCDLIPDKKCDSCGKCIETDKNYKVIKITKIINN